MALRLSTGLRNKMNDAWANGSAYSFFDNAVLEFRTGSQPASANDAPTGTVVATMTLPADAVGASAAGVLSKSGTWQDTSADGTGSAGWFRIRESGDLGTTNTTDERMDGAITATGGGGEITLDNVSIAAGQQVTQNSFAITQPAS